MPATPPSVPTALANFDRTTSRWGRLTMMIGLLLSLAGPAYLIFFTELSVPAESLLKAYFAIATTFGIIWITEPLTYFPMLGPASMYQAFMIGNIANKLLPAAITAQDTLGAKPGTRKAELTSVAAISGAAVVHLMSLLIFVGLLGSWLMTVIPVDLLDTVRTYVLPTIMGAMVVQLFVSTHDKRSAIIATVVAVLCALLLIPALVGVSSVFALLGTPIAVILACSAAWFLRARPAQKDNGDHDQ